MIFKKTLILLAALLIMLFTLLNAVPPSHAVPPSQEIDDEGDVDQLIDKAGYCYNVLEDYPRALAYLNRAVELAVDPYRKSDALIKTAYVYFLMGKSTQVYSGYIKKALLLDGSLELDRLLYAERFINVFATIKNSPQVTADEIDNGLLGEEEEKKNNRRQRFFVMLDAGYLFSLDSDYKRIYGSSNLVPRMKIGFRIAGNFYLWAGYGAVKGKGIIPIIESEVVSAESAQKFLSLGFKYTRNIVGNLGYKLEASTVKVSYSESALGTEVKGSVSGFDLEAGLVYYLGKNLFTECYTGYLSASKLILNKKVTLGGLGMGLGLGMKF